MSNIPNLLPGQEYLSYEHDPHGCKMVIYAYRTEKGAFFSCTCKTETEARDRCMAWMINHERHLPLGLGRNT